MKYRLGDLTVNHWNDWDRVPRMPEAVALFVFGPTFGATATAIFIANVAITAVTSWAISALAPQPDFSSFGSQGTLVNTREATAPADFVYGEVRKGGTVTYYESTGEKNKFLHQIIVLAGHEVHAIGDIYLNDEIVTLDANGFVTDAAWVIDGGANPSAIRIQKFNGSQTTAPADLLAESELTGSDALDANFVGNGIAYLYVRYEYDQTVFASGIPLVTAIINGKKVYDPRTGITAYSNNAALCIRDFITSEYGLNDSAVDDVVFSAAANESDEPVSLSGAGTEKRYTINGIVKASSPIGDVLGKMSTACAGTLFWGSGYWKLKVGAYSAPVKTLTLDDLRGPINLNTRTTMRDSFNGVTGTFNNADEAFITMDYPKLIAETSAGNFAVGQVYTITEVGTTDFTAIGASSNSLGVSFTATGAGSGTGKASAFLGEDGGDELLLDLPLPFTTSAATAQRIAKMTLFRGREQMSISADFGLEAFNVEVGDIIAFTNERYGFEAKEFEVVGWKFASSQDAGDLRVTLTLQETSAAAFEWNAEESDIIGNNTNLPVANAGLAITNLTASDGGRTQGDGTFISFALLDWDDAASAFVSYYDVEWKQVSGSAYNATTTTESTIELSPLIDGTEYQFRVRSVTSDGTTGAYATVNLIAGGDDTAPAAPTSVSAVGSFRYITVSWTNPADTDLNLVEIYENTLNTTSGAYLVGTSAGNNFVRPNLGLDETYWYFLKSVDYSGNKSDYTSGVSATTTYLDDPDFANGVYSLFTEQGLYAIEDVTSLPASGDFVGQKVFNRTDGKLYQWTGTVWEQVVGGAEDFSDLEGSIADAQIPNGLIDTLKLADDAVSTAKLANESVTEAILAAGAITNTKIGSNAVTTAKLANSAVTADILAASAVTETKISSNAITTPKIAAGAVTASEIAAGSITSSKIAANTITAGNIASGTITASELAANSVTATQIAANSVTASEIAAGSITSSKIAANTITAGNIATGAITADEIATNAITSAKITAGAIIGDKIAASTITGDKIGANQITGNNISGQTITGNKIVANTITGGLLATSGIITNSAQINDAVVTNAKIGNLAVSTLKIADQAVSNTGVDEGSLSASNTTSYRTVASVTLSTNAGNQVILWAAGQITFSGAGQGAPSDAKVRLLKGGTVLEEYLQIIPPSASTTRAAPCVIASSTTNATSTTFHVQVANGTAGGDATLAPTMRLVATELKK